MTAFIEPWTSAATREDPEPLFSELRRLRGDKVTSSDDFVLQVLHRCMRLTNKLQNIRQEEFETWETVFQSSIANLVCERTIVSSFSRD